LSERGWVHLLSVMRGRRYAVSLPWTRSKPDSTLLSVGLSSRPLSCLLHAGVDSLSKLQMLKLGELLGLPEFGPKSLVEVVDKLSRCSPPSQSRRTPTGESAPKRPPSDTERLQVETNPTRDSETYEDLLMRVIREVEAKTATCERNS
jgi:hypothetical protein